MRKKVNLMTIIHPMVRQDKIEIPLHDINPEKIEFSIINKPEKRKALLVHSNTLDVYPIDASINEKTLYKTFKDGVMTIKWAQNSQ